MPLWGVPFLFPNDSSTLYMYMSHHHYFGSLLTVSAGRISQGRKDGVVVVLPQHDLEELTDQNCQSILRERQGGAETLLQCLDSLDTRTWRRCTKIHGYMHVILTQSNLNLILIGCRLNCCWPQLGNDLWSQCLCLFQSHVRNSFRMRIRETGWVWFMRNRGL